MMVVKSLTDCQAAGKNFTPIFPQTQFSKLPRPQEREQEISFDFALPFKMRVAQKSKCWFLSIIREAGLKPCFFANSRLEKYLILANYIARLGILQKIPTYPGCFFVVAAFSTFAAHTSISIFSAQLGIIVVMVRLSGLSPPCLIAFALIVGWFWKALTLVYRKSCLASKLQEGPRTEQHQSRTWDVK